MGRFFVVLTVAIVAFVVYRNISSEKAPPPLERQPTPAEKLDALLAQPNVDATALAEISSLDPKLVARRLHNRQITLTGGIESFQVVGTQRKTLRLRYYGAGDTHVCLTIDLLKHSTTITGAGNRGNYEAVGPELIYFEGPEKDEVFRNVSSSAITPTGKVLYRVSEKLTQKARFERLGIGEIHFIAEGTINPAGN